MKKRAILIALIIALSIGAIFFVTRLFLRKADEEKIAPSQKAKVAIVIDDWGYNMRNVELLDSIDIPLTISILPGLPYSSRIAQDQANHNNREIILHMPMEPKDEGLRLERDTLLTSMTDDEILSLLNASLESIPSVRGISNHMGSKATGDEKFVRVLMKELKDKRLFFLDSQVTAGSVCRQEAEALGLDFIARDIFIDNEQEREYILSQIEKLIGLARGRGAALGICHDKTLSLQVIKEKTEELKEDIDFVFASELAK